MQRKRRFDSQCENASLTDARLDDATRRPGDDVRDMLRRPIHHRYHVRRAVLWGTIDDIDDAVLHSMRLHRRHHATVTRRAVSAVSRAAQNRRRYRTLYRRASRTHVSRVSTTAGDDGCVRRVRVRRATRVAVRVRRVRTRANDPASDVAVLRTAGERDDGDVGVSRTVWDVSAVENRGGGCGEGAAGGRAEDVGRRRGVVRERAGGDCETTRTVGEWGDG